MLKEFDIPFSGLKQGKHQFTFDLDNTFFESFGYNDFNGAHVVLLATLNKMSTMMEVVLSGQGDVNINCDLTSEPFSQPVSATLDLVVKFGEEYNDEDDEILILPHGAYQFNIAQYAYEMMVLSIPQKRVHPGVLDGSLQSDTLQKLKELQPKETKNNDDIIDPRWDALKHLLTDK